MTRHDRPFDGHVLVLDGGTGSELRRRGAELSDRCWSAEANRSHLDLLIEIHLDYIRAGADIITANTFATSRFVLASAGLDAHFDEINRSSIDAVRQASKSTDRDLRVAASLSCLPPAFDADAYPPPDAEYRAYSELVACFVDNDVDLILLEMMQDTEHSALACRAVSMSGLPFWIGVSCRTHSRDGRLVTFDNPRQSFVDVLDAVLPFNPEGVAIMHSPVDAIGPAIEELGRHWAGAVGAYGEIPYAQDPTAADDKGIAPDEYAAAANKWLAQGAVLLGGCCGTMPAHIAALKALVDG